MQNQKISLFKLINDKLEFVGYFENTEVIVEYLMKIQEMIDKQAKFNLKGEYLAIPSLHYEFSMVKRNIKSYIDENGYIEPVEELPVNCNNENFDKSKLDDVIGIDIDNAYWTMAYLKGYINENTYKKGLENKEFKPIRLSALSTLGKGKTYKVYKGGIYTNDEISNADKELENFYLDIRFSTYGVLLEIANELKDDFYCWKTDAIFFIDTKENKELVRKRLLDYGLESKVELLKQ